jgi:hypothetical protein
MGYFSSTDDIYAVFTPFTQALTIDPVVGPKFEVANTSFRVIHTEPDGMFLLDTTSRPATLYTGEDAAARPAEVDLTMSADDGHKFWLGQLNLPVALARRKVKVDGGVTKLLGGGLR